MKKLKVHIVGLTHNDVKGREVEYAREAEGRTICLVPDDANPFDMLAVKAYDKQLFIGYVSALEGEDVRALIIARKGRNLRTQCLGSNSKEGADEKSGLQLIVEARVDVSEQEIEQARREIYDDGIYDDWHYSGPILPIDKLTRFSDCTMMLKASSTTSSASRSNSHGIQILLVIQIPLKPIRILLMPIPRRRWRQSCATTWKRLGSDSAASWKYSEAIIRAR